MKYKLIPALALLTAIAVGFGFFVYKTRTANDNATAAALTVTPVTTSVDGQKLYKQAFGVIKEKQFSLTGERLESWVNEWETKYDNQNLTTLGAADDAIKALAESVGAQYFVPSDVAVAADTRAGIGITCEFEGAAELLKDVPKDATKSDLDKVLKFSPKHRFKISSVISDSPASKALVVAVIKSGGKKIVASMEEINKRGIRAGQTVVLAGTHNAEQKLFDGLTMKEAVDLIRGEAGTVATIRVEDVDDDGEPIQVQFICTRAPVRVKGVEAKPLEGGAWLLSVENLMSSVSRDDFIAAAARAKDAKAVIVDLRKLSTITPENLTTIVESLVEQPGIHYQLLDRNGDGMAAMVLGGCRYSINIFKSNRPLNLDLSGFRKERAPAVIPETTPVVFLTSGKAVSARAAIEVVKKFRPNLKVVGAPLEATQFSTTEKLEFGRTLQFVQYDVQPGGVPSKEVKPDVLLSEVDLSNNATAITAALTAVGIKPEEKPAR